MNCPRPKLSLNRKGRILNLSLRLLNGHRKFFRLRCYSQRSSSRRSSSAISRSATSSAISECLLRQYPCVRLDDFLLLGVNGKIIGLQLFFVGHGASPLLPWTTLDRGLRSRAGLFPICGAAALDCHPQVRGDAGHPLLEGYILIAPVANLRDDGLKARFARMFEHLSFCRNRGFRNQAKTEVSIDVVSEKPSALARRKRAVCRKALSGVLKVNCQINSISADKLSISEKNCHNSS